MFARAPYIRSTSSFARTATSKTTKSSLPSIDRERYTFHRSITLPGKGGNSRKTMATASTITLSAAQKPTFYVEGISEESANVASRLLQENHEKHHIFFNYEGFHNHIVHHLLTIFALKATPAEIQKGYDENKSYQRPPIALDRAIVQDMHELDRFKTYLGQEKYYHDFLVFFQGEIAKEGWESVIKEYVFKGDERADDMLVRMFAGFLHPIIHLGFGVEFQQPAIIAEALAQAAVHDNWIAPLFLESEKVAKTNGSDPSKTPTIIDLLGEIRADKVLSTSARWEDRNKIDDGVLKRAGKEMIEHASHYVIGDGEDILEEKTAEMINAVVYYTASAQSPPHIPKFDFFHIHCVNSSIFLSTFLSPSSPLTHAQKKRLLEWKVRVDLAMYASRRAPALLFDEVAGYKPSSSAADAALRWENIFKRATAFSDDGHVSKFVRALAHGEKACKRFEGRRGFVVEGEVWRRLACMVLDSVEAGGPKWVMSCGFEEAWEDVPIRDGARL